jgi:hypothetical protein
VHEYENLIRPVLQQSQKRKIHKRNNQLIRKWNMTTGQPAHFLYGFPPLVRPSCHHASGWRPNAKTVLFL